MSPPVESFPAIELPWRIQGTTEGKRRKKLIELDKCQLMEFVQYSCILEGESAATARIKCVPIVRLFRKY